MSKRLFDAVELTLADILTHLLSLEGYAEIPPLILELDQLCHVVPTSPLLGCRAIQVTPITATPVELPDRRQHLLAHLAHHFDL